MKPETELFMYRHKAEYCERNHTFCPDCRDKLKPGECLRCKCQSLEGKLECSAQRERDSIIARIRGMRSNPQCHFQSGDEVLKALEDELLMST